MLDFVKKTLLTGLGLAYMTKEKIEETAADLSRNAKLSEEEGRKLYQQLWESSQKAKQDLESRISAAVDKAMTKMPVSSEKIAALEARIAALEAKAGCNADDGAE